MPKTAPDYALPKATTNPLDYLQSQGAIDDFCVGCYGTANLDPAERERVGRGMEFLVTMLGPREGKA